MVHFIDYVHFGDIALNIIELIILPSQVQESGKKERL